MKRIMVLYVMLWALVVTSAVVACSQQQARERPTHTHSAVACHYRGSGLMVLPDVSCTPGALNPAVTQATIRTTICKAGWTATVRPPLSYTSKIKTQDMAMYGVTDQTKYELDHLVPLELGGAPSAKTNLWVEPNYATPHPTRYDHNPKDVLEFVLRNKVCAKRPSMDLQTAQQAIMSDWVMTFKALGLKP